jgi:hypothetical protein
MTTGAARLSIIEAKRLHFRDQGVFKALWAWRKDGENLGLYGRSRTPCGRPWRIVLATWALMLLRWPRFARGRWIGFRLRRLLQRALLIAQSFLLRNLAGAGAGAFARLSIGAWRGCRAFLESQGLAGFDVSHDSSGA